MGDHYRVIQGDTRSSDLIAHRKIPLPTMEDIQVL